MYTLTAEKREDGVKAKALRRQGFVIGNLTGKGIDGSQPLKFAKLEAEKFSKANKEGSHITLVLDGEKIDAMLEGVDFNSMKNEITSMDFQKLVANEKVQGIAQVKLLNEDKTGGFVTQETSEIKYKALPDDMVETIEIDLMEYKVGDSIHVADLEISRNDKIDVKTPAETLVFNISAHTKNAVPDDDVEETETTTPEA